MIKLTRFNRTNYVLNCDLIEMVESTPDTVITTITGKKYLVAETVEEIVEKVIEYKKKIQLIEEKCV